MTPSLEINCRRVSMKKQQTYCTFLMMTFFCASSLFAQETSDAFKLKLRESLLPPNEKTELKHYPIKIKQWQNNKKPLTVSPDTKLPTKFDRIKIYELLLPEEKINISLNVTNRNMSQNERSGIDYSAGKVHPIPDARSITQFCQYTTGDLLGVYADSNSPQWLKSLRNHSNPRYQDRDLDPIRMIERRKAAKRKQKWNMIFKHY